MGLGRNLVCNSWSRTYLLMTLANQSQTTFIMHHYPHFPPLAKFTVLMRNPVQGSLKEPHPPLGLNFPSYGPLVYTCGKYLGSAEVGGSYDEREITVATAKIKRTAACN